MCVKETAVAPVGSGEEKNLQAACCQGLSRELLRLTDWPFARSRSTKMVILDTV